MANLINWFKNKITFLNGSLPAINDVSLNNLQFKIESDLSDFVQGDLNNYISGVPIGSGYDYYGLAEPENYMWADGRELSRIEYAKLFEVFGGENSPYGLGDGSTTFNLPDKRKRVSVMKGDDDTLGAKVGSDSVTLKTTNLPKVDLGIVVTNVEGKTVDDFNRTYNNTGVYNVSKTTKSLSFGSDNPTAIDNRQSSFICNYIIKVK